jgi:UDP-2,3-diacylglucosamine hydrolase
MIYFLSDAHLGSRLIENSREHEQKLVRWLEQIRRDAEAIYLLGDIFDFWFEYKTVVPKGFVRFLGKLAELTDQGIEIHFFTGNHDIWTFGYLEEEIGLIVHREPLTYSWATNVFIWLYGERFVHQMSQNFFLLEKFFTIPLPARIFPTWCRPTGTGIWLLVVEKK